MGDVENLEDINIRGRLIKALLKATGLTEIMGRYFDPKRRVDYSRHDLEIWPGYFTALKHRDNKLYIEVGKHLFVYHLGGLSL